MPPGIRQHLIDRMHDRNIGLDDLNRLRLWIKSQPEVPDGDWFNDFGSFKLCGKGEYPKISAARASRHWKGTVAPYD